MSVGEAHMYPRNHKGFPKRHSPQTLLEEMVQGSPKPLLVNHGPPDADGAPPHAGIRENH